MREDIGRGKARIEENKVKEKRKKKEIFDVLQQILEEKKGVFDILKQLRK